MWRNTLLDMKFALIQVEQFYFSSVCGYPEDMTESCFLLRGEFDTLEEAKTEQSKMMNKSIIINSY